MKLGAIMRRMMVEYEAGVFIIAITLVITIPCSKSRADAPEDVALAGVEARLAQLQNLVVHYDKTTVSDLSSLTAARSGNAVLTQAPLVQESEETFSFFHGYAKLESRARDIASAERNREPVVSATVLTPERMEVYDQFHLGVPGGGGVTTMRRWSWEIDSCLGMREFLVYKWFDADILRAMHVELPSETQVVLSRLIENGNASQRWIYDRKLGFALTRYELVSNVDHLSTINIVNDDFRQIDNVMLPFRMTITLGIAVNGKAIVTQTHTYIVHGYEVNPKDNDPSEYRMEWPAGATIVDETTGSAVHNGAQTRPMTDQDIADADARQKAAKQLQLQRTQDRIDRILGTTRPSTEPATRPGS